MSIKMRISRLEGREREAVPGDFGSVFGRALQCLSDEDFEALAEVLDRDPGPADEPVDFERLYEAVDARGRRGLEGLFAAMDAVRKGGVRRWA